MSPLPLDIVSDFENGKLYDFDQEHPDDAGAVIARATYSVSEDVLKETQAAYRLLTG